MNRSWTFGRKVGAGFALMVALVLAIASLATFALQRAVAAKDRVIAVNVPNLIDAQRLRTAVEKKGGAARGFLLTKDESYLTQMQAARADFLAAANRIGAAVDTDESRRQLDKIREEEVGHQAALERVIALRRSDTTSDPAGKLFDEQVSPKRGALDTEAEAFIARERSLLEAGRLGATEIAAVSTRLVLALGALSIALAILVALVLTRTLGRQIGGAVAQVQTSSAELQAAANQQATASREQATAMAEISTTISELLATSRQIAASAQRVAQIAGETATGARGGASTVERANESIAAIRRQVDVIVGHMLDLGKKSQQIGSVLDIVSELAEQTNILAINASIEAAGAGDAGRRFGVVADEIRKLADRVAGSTKEIRGLIEHVRGAVNTTVMATEGGSKAVDLGAKQFVDVASSFGRIAGLVGTTTDAAREIELSTKQQATAVEQVNIAIGNVAQASRETEASASQSLDAAQQLGHLAQELLRVVTPASA
jgi:methyl-accepting chemotaxis protein